MIYTVDSMNIFNCGFELRNATYADICQATGGMAKESSAVGMHQFYLELASIANRNSSK